MIQQGVMFFNEYGGITFAGYVIRVKDGKDGKDIPATILADYEKKIKKPEKQKNTRRNIYD